jgi:hypothetical protein
MKSLNKFALAAATAALFAGAIAPVAHAEEAAGVKCEGINSCKGTSKCATATTSCSGQNACKGMHQARRNCQAVTPEGPAFAAGLSRNA